MQGTDAGELLDTVGQVSKEARRARHGYWFPLVLFGLIILGTLFFLRPPSGPWVCPPGQLHGDTCGGPPSRLNFLLGMFGGGMNAAHGWGLGLFWLVSIPLGFLATLVFYRIQGRRKGIEGRVWPYVVAGITPFAVAILTHPAIATWMHMPRWFWWWRIRYTGNLEFRGLLPILLITLGFFVLARLERSRILGGIAAAFFGLALLANLYNISNAFQRLHWVVPDWATNPSVTGGFLIFVGLVSWLGMRRHHEPSG